MTPRRIAFDCYTFQTYANTLFNMHRRDVNDVVHKIVAVGSRSVEKAKEFIDREIKDDSVKPYGSYDELFADKVGNV